MKQVRFVPRGMATLVFAVALSACTTLGLPTPSHSQASLSSEPAPPEPPLHPSDARPSNSSVAAIWKTSPLLQQLRGITDRILVDVRPLVAEQIEYETEVAAGHEFPTDGAGGACGENAPPLISDCGYDAAGRMFRHLYDGLVEPTTDAGGEVVEFDQTRYATGSGAISLEARGFLFVPASCAADEPCRLHVAFHGCGQGVGFVGRAFASDADYNRWAVANRIVVLYPQAAPSRVAPFNPQGFWDWWGYSGTDYAAKSGAQLSAILALMIECPVRHISGWPPSRRRIKTAATTSATARTRVAIRSQVALRTQAFSNAGKASR